MKITLCYLLSIILVGCATSPTVWSIGAKSINGSVGMTSEPQTRDFELVESKLIAHKDAGFLMPSYPYQELEPINQNVIGKASFLFKDVTWKNDYKGEVLIDVRGARKEFAVTKTLSRLDLVHYNREWYGYPAQLLLLITYPLDVVFGVVGSVLHVLSMPFAESSNSSKNNENAISD